MTDSKTDRPDMNGLLGNLTIAYKLLDSMKMDGNPMVIDMASTTTCNHDTMKNQKCQFSVDTSAFVKATDGGMKMRMSMEQCDAGSFRVYMDAAGSKVKDLFQSAITELKVGGCATDNDCPSTHQCTDMTTKFGRWNKGSYTKCTDDATCVSLYKSLEGSRYYTPDFTGYCTKGGLCRTKSVGNGNSVSGDVPQFLWPEAVQKAQEKGDFFVNFLRKVLKMGPNTSPVNGICVSFLKEDNFAFTKENLETKLGKYDNNTHTWKAVGLKTWSFDAGAGGAGGGGVTPGQPKPPNDPSNPNPPKTQPPTPGETSGAPAVFSLFMLNVVVFLGYFLLD